MISRLSFRGVSAALEKRQAAFPVRPWFRASPGGPRRADRAPQVTSDGRLPVGHAATPQRASLPVLDICPRFKTPDRRTKEVKKKKKYRLAGKRAHVWRDHGLTRRMHWGSVQHLQFANECAMNVHYMDQNSCSYTAVCNCTVYYDRQGTLPPRASRQCRKEGTLCLRSFCTSRGCGLCMKNLSIGRL